MLQLFGVPSKLTLIPGVGARVASRLISFFGSEAEALRAISYCRISLLEEAVGKPTAVRLVHGVYRLAYGRWPRDVAGSDEAWSLFQAVRSVYEESTLTSPGRDILSCYLPAPPSGLRDAIDRMELLTLYRKVVDTAGDLVDRVLERVSDKLHWPKPVPHPAAGGRVLVVLGDREAYRKAVDSLSSLVKVVYADDPSEANTKIEGVEDVVVYDPYGLYTGPYPVIGELNVEEVLPETIVDYFRVNWRALEAIAELAKEVGLEGVTKLAELYGIDVDTEQVERLIWASKVLHGGEVSEQIDEEYRRLRRTLSKLEAVVDDVEAWINERLREELERLEIRIPASRLLEVIATIQRGEQPMIELPEELYEVFTRVAEEAEKAVKDRLELEPDEAELIRGIAPRTPSYPVVFDRSRVTELRALLASKLGRRRLEVLRMLASQVKGLRRVLDELVQLLAYMDAGRAWYRLATVRLAVKPTVADRGVGVAFRNGLEAELARRVLRGEDAQRVSYIVGDVRVPWDNPTRGERIVLLTGANSGGKTTLLKTIAETVLAAQSGLPVLAEEAVVTPFETVYFVSKPAGEVGAGALEQLLSSLAKIASQPGRKLVLVDELEAATEAGAAAKIVAGFLQALSEQEGSVAIVVTHLAEHVTYWLEKMNVKGVRVDGIEARGLDENYNLIVDRNPRYYHLARSTPELVVRRLEAKARRRGEREFYSRLLSLLSSRA